MLDLALSIGARACMGVAAFTPARLFAGGVAGAWYDPSDLSTLFQDSAGTTPVTADGDPVGKMLDKSGNGNHLLQATAGKRPLYKTSGGLSWLQFDGTDDVLAVNAANLRLVGDLTLSVAAYKNGASTYGGILCCQTNAATINPYEWRFAPNATVLQPDFVAANGAATEQDLAGGPNDVGILATPTVVSLRRSIGVNIEHSVNKSRTTYAHTMVPTSDASSVFTMGDRNTTGIPLAGRIYQAVVNASLLSDINLAKLETYLGSKAGLSL